MVGARYREDFDVQSSTVSHIQPAHRLLQVRIGHCSSTEQHLGHDVGCELPQREVLHVTCRQPWEMRANRAAKVSCDMIFFESVLHSHLAELSYHGGQS